MIVEYCVAGFKGLKEFCLNPGQHVIIYGPPGAGKTSVVESIGVLAQSRGEDWIVLEGHYVVIHDPSEIHYNGDLSRPIRWRIHVRDRGRILGYEYEYRSSDSWARQSVLRDFVRLITVEREEGGGLITYPSEPAGLRTCIPPVPVINEIVLTLCQPADDERLKDAEYALFELRNLLKDSIYILTERRISSWKRTFEAYANLMPSRGVGSDGQYTVYQLSRIYADPTLERERGEVNELLKEVGIDEVSIGIVSSGRLGGYVRMGGRLSSVYSAGLFVKSLLPILVQLVMSNAGSVLIVDDVELGVSEDRYEKLMHLIKDFTGRKGMQLIATTRSRLLAKVAEKLGYQVVEMSTA